MSLRQVLETWNPWWSVGEVPSSLTGEERKITKEIFSWLGKRKIKVILGPRRAGKTTVMYQLISKIVKKDPLKAVYVNFEDPELQDAGFKKVYEEAKKIGGKKAFIFFDEIQNIKDWDKYLRSIHDRRDPVDLIISGSTMAMLGKEVQKRIAGRTVSFKVYPFSLLEASEIRGINPFDPREEEAFLGLVKELFTTGSYPEIFLEKNPNVKKKLLVEYYEGIVSRDVAAAHDLDLHLAEEISRYLLRNAGSLVSINKLSKLFKIAFHTTEKYLNALKDSMIMFEVRRYSHSIREQLAFHRKVYPIDLGLRWAVSKGPSPDLGKCFESLIGIELFKQGTELYYWSNHGECDFVLAEQGKPYSLVQVTFDKRKARELEGIKLASRELKVKISHVVEFKPESIINLLTKNAKV